MDYLGLDKKKVEKTVKKLNELLSSYQLHYQKLRNFHWNLKSTQFFVLHDKFEEFYTDANTKIDDIAERILTLQGQPLSQLADYLENSTIKPSPENLQDAQMVKEVLKDYAELIKLGRKVVELASDADDEGTVDMIGGFIGEQEKTCWMLTAWLKKHSPKELEEVHA